jgi:hypothetical protein
MTSEDQDLPGMLALAKGVHDGEWPHTSRASMPTTSNTAAQRTGAIARRPTPEITGAAKRLPVD